MTIKKAEEGKASVELAIRMLCEFYEQHAIPELQCVPPNSDREGYPVGDLAPEVWEGEYFGKQTESKGIFSLLEVILSDFARTIDTVTSDEELAQGVFVKVKKDRGGHREQDQS